MASSYPGSTYSFTMRVASSPMAQPLRNVPLDAIQPLPEDPSCAFCGESPPSLLRCSRCRVVVYCTKDHQIQHRSTHKTACNNIAKTSRQAEARKALLQKGLGSGKDLFEASKGIFRQQPETQKYLHARFAMFDALDQLTPANREAVKMQLDILMDLLHLDVEDALAVRQWVPALMLRLGRIQECYDFIQWWGTTGLSDDYKGLDNPAQHMKVAKPSDVFSLPGFLLRRDEPVSIAHVVAMMLLEIQLLIDLVGVDQALRLVGDKASCPGPNDPKLLAALRSHKPSIALVAAKRQQSGPRALYDIAEDLTAGLTMTACTAKQTNPAIRELLLDFRPEDMAQRPQAIGLYSREEAVLNLHQTWRAWTEAPGALRVVRTLISKFRA